MKAILIAALLAAAPAARNVEMKVTDEGFEPSRIEVKKGEPAPPRRRPQDRRHLRQGAGHQGPVAAQESSMGRMTAACVGAN